MNTSRIIFGLLIASFVIGIPQSIKSQSTSVGINQANPQEELDVDGDINLTGTIKFNMQSPSEGQVPVAQSNGTLSWVDLDKYEHFKEFNGVSSTASWTVPAGVSKFMFEIWGGGGYGMDGGGGGAGGYVRGYAELAAGQSITITVGRGGSSTYSPGDSKIEWGIHWIKAYAGSNATSSYSGWGGSGGGTNSTLYSYIQIEGEDGWPTRIRYDQVNSTDHMREYAFGNGGDSPLRPLTGGNGGIRVYQSSTGTWPFAFNYRGGNNPGGGGGGYNTTTYGGNGRVILYW